MTNRDEQRWDKHTGMHNKGNIHKALVAKAKALSFARSRFENPDEKDWIGKKN
jgi:hypothetical protein